MSETIQVFRQSILEQAPEGTIYGITSLLGRYGLGSPDKELDQHHVLHNVEPLQND
jgi:hypothetical protein